VLGAMWRVSSLRFRTPGSFGGGSTTSPG
jgi:hypothetical protein